MADPYRCLRVTTIGIGVYNIIYCLVQYAVLGWQIKTVKVLQWEYENRQLPPTGSIDGFQARFPGLYAIYTETPERRRINAMLVIVLICLGLSIIHLMTTFAMLYGVLKRAPNLILPWFFTCAPLVIMCTAYAVLWWSGDIFNEQLTMSVTEFVMSLAVNGMAFIVVLLYYLRITGRLTSDKPAPRRRPAAFANQSFEYSGDSGAWDPRTGQAISPYATRQQRRLPQSSSYPQSQQQQMYGPEQSYPTDSMSRQQQKQRARSRSSFAEPTKKLPPWHEPMPDQPSYAVGRKMRRRERERAQSPVATLRQDYKYRVTHPFNATASLRRQSSYDTRPQSASQLTNFEASYASPVPVKYTHMTSPVILSRQQSMSTTQNIRTPDQTRPATRYMQQQSSSKSQPAALRRSSHRRAPVSSNATSRLSSAMVRRKSPQRVSFKSRPKVYECTPESSQTNSGGQRQQQQFQPTMREIHTVV